LVSGSLPDLQILNGLVEIALLQGELKFLRRVFKFSAGHAKSVGMGLDEASEDQRHDLEFPKKHSKGLLIHLAVFFLHYMLDTTQEVELVSKPKPTIVEPENTLRDFSVGISQR